MRVQIILKAGRVIGSTLVHNDGKSEIIRSEVHDYDVDGLSEDTLCVDKEGKIYCEYEV